MIERLDNYKNTGKRWYRLTESEVYDAPSVTTLCDHIVHTRLKQWYINKRKSVV